MRYYMIAGERSGDLHGAGLIKALKTEDPEAEVRCMGGELMENTGAEKAFDYSRVSYMGFLEPFLNLPKIYRFLRRVKKDVLEFKPDVLILIDYPGFNLKMAHIAHDHGIRVFYYISPKIWAWNQSRAKKIKRWVDRMFVILPFEKEFYQRFDYEVDYVGNPLVKAVGDFDPDPSFRERYSLGELPLIAILPGSRKQEVKNNLPILLQMVEYFPGYQFVVGGVDNLSADCYQEAVSRSVPVVIDQTYNVLYQSSAALVVSGTATLETMLFQVPQVVCYKTSWVTYWIGRMLIRVEFISLVNLIAQKELVRELIQSDLEENRLRTELHRILQEPGRGQQLAAYASLAQNLSQGDTPRLTAKIMMEALLK